MPADPIPSDSRIANFVEKASAAGIPPESMAKVLTARGWPEKDVYDALADHYHRLTGVEVPRRGGVAASAKDAFFYLLIFSTLATWTVAFGCLAFTLIDRWIADPLFTGYQQNFDSYTISWSLAALIVAFPLYLLVSRAVAGDAVRQPEKLDSPVRKWLTYMALVIAACVFMGDLIAVLTHLLRGELTSRFVLKALVVLALSGGVFTYYFSGLRRTDISDTRKGRDRWIAALSSSIVAVILLLGFWQLGSPGTQREFRADAQRVQSLYQVSTQIKGYWSSHQSQLPSNLDQLPGSPFVDPMTRKPFEYHPGQGSQYQLCATFARSSERRDLQPEQNVWAHSAGHHCLTMDATAQASYPVQYPMD
jgi:Domain of unknown function (DUF5671)